MTGNACVVGSGPNGLTAAIVLAKAGLRTTVYEEQPTIGGGARSAELTLPGFVHDVCSAVHPWAASSPAFATFPLAEHGLEWIQPPLPLAHPLDDGSAAVLAMPIEDTCARLGPDGAVYRRAIGPLARRWRELLPIIQQPLLRFPAHPWLLARFGALAFWPAAASARLLFRTEAARALFAGIAAHSVLPLEALGSAAFGWVLAIAGHAVGWPIPRGGSQSIANALASYFESLGGSIVTNHRIGSLDELGDAAPVLCDLTPRQFVAVAGSRLPARYRRQLEAYRYGPGVFKIDWALSAPIPWTAAECGRAGTIHVGGSLDEIAASERASAGTAASERPFVLVAQPSLFDASRAPAGKHTAWGYCHVPHASTEDMTERIESQVERFAPGFRARILARHTATPADLERHNANLVGGDITGGAQDLKQLVLRPTRLFYRTPLAGVYLCSSSTPPGGAVHGMCGFHAAETALRGIRNGLLTIATIALMAALLCAPGSAQQDPAQATKPPSTTEKWHFFIEETATPFTLVASGVNAAVSEATRSDPQYGVGGVALTKRFGAAVGDNITQNFFSDFVLASALHEDTRYIRKGPSHGFWSRFSYAVSRAFVTRTDAGERTTNWANLLGCGLQAGLSNAYYPPPSQTGRATAINWANSVAGSGFGNLFPEFLPDFKKWLKKHHL